MTLHLVLPKQKQYLPSYHITKNPFHLHPAAVDPFLFLADNRSHSIPLGMPELVGIWKPVPIDPEALLTRRKSDVWWEFTNYTDCDTWPLPGT